MNDGGVVLFGRSRGELVGASIAALIRPDEQGNAAESWLALQRTGEFVARRTFVRADGSDIKRECAARLAIVGGRRLALCVLLGRNGPPPDTAPRSRAAGAPTQREREVVTLIALGLETDQIADELSISRATVRTHVRNAMTKLGAHTRAQLVAIVLTRNDAIRLAGIEE